MSTQFHIGQIVKLKPGTVMPKYENERAVIRAIDAGPRENCTLFLLKHRLQGYVGINCLMESGPILIEDFLKEDNHE